MNRKPTCWALVMACLLGCGSGGTSLQNEDGIDNAGPPKDSFVDICDCDTGSVVAEIDAVGDTVPMDMDHVSGPCLKAEPAEVDFGTVVTTTPNSAVVTLISCGDQAVEITDVRLTEDSSADFGLNLSGMGEFSVNQPLILEPGTNTELIVMYLPPSVDYDSGGNVIPDTGIILVDNSSVDSPRAIPIVGIGIAPECPVTDFKIMARGLEVPDGGDVPVETNLQFLDQSYDPTIEGDIVAWEWSVVPPAGSADVFFPSAVFKDPSFEANMVGDYIFHLKVYNKLGIESCCGDAEKLVHVKAGDGCHLELTWDTPNDPDPTDHCSGFADCGSDMDLHVVHPLAGGPDVDQDGKPDGFFVPQYDCFWFDPHPVWVEDFAADPTYQPHLSKDDRDGAGPEIFTYSIPEPGLCYKVGVHYWDDHGFGASHPTIRMFIDGKEVYEKTGPKMQNLDMWEVGEACCTDNANPMFEYQSGGEPLVVPGYVNPDFIPEP